MLFAVYVFYILSKCLLGQAAVLYDAERVMRAMAQIQSEYDSVKGIVTFEQRYTPNSPCKIHANVTGVYGEHGFAILDWGNMVGGCHTMGDTFNPDHVRHSPFGKKSHRVGTLGNITDGQYEDQENHHVSLYGRNSVIGRGIAIFENPDDGGENDTNESHRNGSVGEPIACGIIARVAEEFGSSNDEFVS